MDYMHSQVPVLYLVRDMAIDLDCRVSSNIAARSVRHQSSLGLPQSYWA
jgi:hypothetical protein